VTRRRWTFPELYQAARDVESGKTWREVADALNCNEATLRSTLRAHGVEYDLRKRPPKEHPRADMLREAIRLRNTERLSWGLIARRIGWPHQPQSLKKAVSRHCEAHGWNYTKGMPEVRLTKWGTVSRREG
jgi:transposase-like protein